MKTMLKMFLSMLLSAICVSGSLAQTEPQAFSLQQAVDYALQNQPEEIQNAWIDLSMDLCEIPKYLSHSEHVMVIAKKTMK